MLLCPSGVDFPYFLPKLVMDPCTEPPPHCLVRMILDVGWDTVFASWFCVENQVSTLVSSGKTISFKNQICLFVCF